MKVIIIDDSKVMRAIVKRTLRQAGFKDIELVEAADGQEGLDAIEANPPDLVLSDWNMPNMSGIALLEELRKRGNEVKFGFVTSEGSDEMRQRATDAGAMFLITKPFTPDNFRESLGEVLSA